jgi:hypothetical protein
LTCSFGTPDPSALDLAFERGFALTLALGRVRRLLRLELLRGGHCLLGVTRFLVFPSLYAGFGLFVVVAPSQHGDIRQDALLA